MSGFKLDIRSLSSAVLISTLCLPSFAQVQVERPRRQNSGAQSDKKDSAVTPEQKKLKEENQQLAKDLLARAYGMSKQLSEADRAYLVAKLAQASSKSMPDKSQAWADEVFQLSSGLPNDMQRTQNEMTAMMAIAENDPEHALQLLTKMEPPAARADGSPAPDTRSGAAAMLFQKYWQKRGVDGLETLQATARQLGESGFYPFMAMGSIIRQISRKDKDKAQSMTNEALSFFSRRSRSDSATQQLAMFLRMNRDLVPQPVMKDILGQLVSDALETKDSNKSGTVAVFSSGRGTATMSGAANLVLFQLLPLIREIDPDWAKKVEAQSAELRASANLSQGSAGGGPERMGVFMGGPNGGAPPANMMEEMKSMEVDELVSQDPKQALKVADEIQDPVIRAATSARLAGDLNNSDPERAAELTKSAREALAKTKDPADKLRIIVGLAQAQSAMKDKEGFTQALDQAYVIAEELFRKSVDKNPDAPIASRPGIDSMTRLTVAGIRLDSAATLAHLDSVRSPLLQALLLVAAAQGLDPESKPQDGAFRIQIRS